MRVYVSAGMLMVIPLPLTPAKPEGGELRALASSMAARTLQLPAASGADPVPEDGVHGVEVRVNEQLAGGRSPAQSRDVQLATAQVLLHTGPVKVSATALSCISALIWLDVRLGSWASAGPPRRPRGGGRHAGTGQDRVLAVGQDQRGSEGGVFGLDGGDSLSGGRRCRA